MRMLLCVLAICGVLVSARAGAARIELADDRMAVVDGDRAFILGLYETPGDDAVLREVAEAGFNLVQVPADKSALDRLESFGLWAWINTGAAIDLSAEREAREQRLRAMVTEHGPHPAMLIWEVPDEALWNNWYLAQGWRTRDEPNAIAERLDALEDTALATRLREQLAEARRLYSEGEYAEGEALADGIWTQLGEPSPRPGFGLSTAAERSAVMCAGMLEGYRLLKEIDRDHLIWMNHAPRNQIEQLAAYNLAADLVGCDIYPVPVSPRFRHSDLAEQTPAAVGAYTTRMQEAAPGKPVWMVLQGFGWSDLYPEHKPQDEAEIDPGRRPTLAESRFMAYDAVARGARGILYWGTAYIEKDSELWRDLLTLINELSSLQHVLSAREADLPMTVAFEETFGSVDRGIVAMPKQVGDKVWFIVVNEWVNPLKYTLGGLEALEGTRYRDDETGREAVVVNGELTLPIRSQSVHILAPE